MIRSLLPFLFAAGLAAADLPAGLFVAQPPTAAHVEVIAARVSPQPGAEISLTGVVGGRPKPFVEGRAIFTIMDNSLVCSSGCGTAWSGCSLPPEQLRGGVATIQVLDADGKPLAAALEGAHGLVPGTPVVITGTVAPGSGEKALIVTAQAIHLVSPDAAKPH